MKPDTYGEKFDHLVKIMARLRSPQGCIWDRQQTHDSLRQYLLEETYEVLESIDDNNLEALGQELGDLLLQVIFHAQIAAESGRFDVGTVIDNISGKMIRRHPHVFGDEKVASVAEQKLRWEEIKKQEGRKSVLEGVPAALPALQRAARLQQKANAPAPDWEDVEALCRRLKTMNAGEERKGETAERERVLGELLFALVGVNRTAGVNAEDVLRAACERFQQSYSSDQASRA